MPELISQLFTLLGVELAAPQNLAELFPWLIKILVCTGFVSFFLGTIRSLCISLGKGVL